VSLSGSKHAIFGRIAIHIGGEFPFLQSRCDLAGLIRCSKASSGMGNIKPTRRFRLQPLETGQIWKMAEWNLKVGLIGNLLMHYKLARPDAIAGVCTIENIAVVEKYLKKHKAVLIQG
jgi:hypothetical protein